MTDKEMAARDGAGEHAAGNVMPRREKPVRLSTHPPIVVLAQTRTRHPSIEIALSGGRPNRWARRPRASSCTSCFCGLSRARDFLLLRRTRAGARTRRTPDARSQRAHAHQRPLMQGSPRSRILVDRGRSQFEAKAATMLIASASSIPTAKINVPGRIRASVFTDLCCHNVMI